jgi:hypothetical protein
MDASSQNKMPAETQDKKAELERRGYRISHLSALEIEELLELIEQEQAARDWRSSL